MVSNQSFPNLVAHNIMSHLKTPRDIVNFRAVERATNAAYQRSPESQEKVTQVNTVIANFISTILNANSTPQQKEEAIASLMQLLTQFPPEKRLKMSMKFRDYILTQNMASKEQKEAMGKMLISEITKYRNWYKDLRHALILVGADIDVQNANGHMAIHGAAQKGCLETTKLLLMSGADKNARDRPKDTALHYAAINNHPAIIRELIANGADKNPLDSSQFTPLHLAARPWCKEAFNALIEAGADPTIQNKNGNTVQEYLEKMSSTASATEVGQSSAGRQVTKPNPRRRR